MNPALEIVRSRPADGVAAHAHARPFALSETRVASGPKFAPNHLVSEGGDGKPVFAEEAVRASSRSREQARLFYEQGVKEARLVNARRWHEVQCQHSPEEISRAENIIIGLETVRKHTTLCKAFRREERSGAPNPRLLDSLDSRIKFLRPEVESVRELIASASAREVALVKVLERLTKDQRKARGWKLKAQRQVACGLFGMQYDAEKCGRAYFRPFHCRNRYCPVCGPSVHRKLVAKYLGLERLIEDFLAGRPSYRLRILDVTAIKRSEQMPVRRQNL